MAVELYKSEFYHSNRVKSVQKNLEIKSSRLKCFSNRISLIREFGLIQENIIYTRIYSTILNITIKCQVLIATIRITRSRMMTDSAPKNNRLEIIESFGSKATEQANDLNRFWAYSIRFATEMLAPSQYFSNSNIMKFLIKCHAGRIASPYTRFDVDVFYCAKLSILEINMLISPCHPLRQGKSCPSRGQSGRMPALLRPATNFSVIDLVRLFQGSKEGGREHSNSNQPLNMFLPKLWTFISHLLHDIPKTLVICNMCIFFLEFESLHEFKDSQGRDSTYVRPQIIVMPGRSLKTNVLLRERMQEVCSLCIPP